MDSPLREAVRRLVEAYQPEAIWLFGSQARGDAGPDSDYDLMVIVPDDADRKRSQSMWAYPLLWGIGTAIDVLVWKHSDFYRRLEIVSSIATTITEEGKLLYAA
jgi:uncharacterized protein